MSIFDDNIQKSLTVGNIYDISFDISGFAFSSLNTLIQSFFFKWVYNEDKYNAAHYLIQKLNDIPIEVIQGYNDNPRRFRRLFKKYVKHEFSKHMSVENVNGIFTIFITIPVHGSFGTDYDENFKIVLIPK